MCIEIVSFKWVKSAILVLVCFAFGKLDAQVTLPTESGKVVFYDVIQTDSLTKNALYQNAHHWFTAHQYNFTVDSSSSESYSLKTSSEFPVYATGYVSKKQNGVVSYTLQLEIKDQKYRYRFTDFVFHYYQQNRTYQLVSTGKLKPLEETNADGWQKTWDYNRKTTQQVINSLIAELKKQMIYRASTEKTSIAPKKDW